MQMREATLIWPPVSCYYGNNIKTTKCLKRSTFIPVSLWSSQEISIPGNRRARRGKQLCIWKAALAAWTKNGGFSFSGDLAKEREKTREKKNKKWGNNHEQNIEEKIRKKFHDISFSVLTVHIHVKAGAHTSPIFCPHPPSTLHANIKKQTYVRILPHFIISCACGRARRPASHRRCKWVSVRVWCWLCVQRVCLCEKKKSRIGGVGTGARAPKEIWRPTSNAASAH